MTDRHTEIQKNRQKDRQTEGETVYLRKRRAECEEFRGSLKAVKVKNQKCLV